MKRSSSLMAAMIVLFPAFGWAQDTGAEAFAARDFATAEQLWLQEAANGDAEAMLGLGLLADRGFGGRRDTDAAFNWYAKAADLGLAEAQFNLAIMYDGGSGRSRDAGLAATWYTRAALRGHARAQYNLGLLYETGDGIDANTTLAARWFDQAASEVPAAAEKDLATAPQTGALAPPALAFAQAGPQGAELVWTAITPQTYLVEVLKTPSPGEDYANPVLTQNTNLSGLLAENITTDANAVWRVSNINAARNDYAPSDWRGADDVTPPRGRITFQLDAEIPAMMIAADVFASDLRAAGYWVRLENGAADTDYISYGFTSDATMAAVVANYLPQLDAPTRSTQAINTTQPGEIIVNLSAFR